MKKQIASRTVALLVLELLALPTLAKDSNAARTPAMLHKRSYSHRVIFFSDSMRLNFCTGEDEDDRNGGGMAQEYRQNAPAESQKKAKEYCAQQLKANSDDSTYSCTVGKTEAAEIRIGNDFFCKTVTYAEEGGHSED